MFAGLIEIVLAILHGIFGKPKTNVAEQAGEARAGLAVEEHSDAQIAKVAAAEDAVSARIALKPDSVRDGSDGFSRT